MNTEGLVDSLNMCLYTLFHKDDAVDELKALQKITAKTSEEWCKVQIAACGKVISDKHIADKLLLAIIQIFEEGHCLLDELEAAAAEWTKTKAKGN